ncbi:neuroendocrine protein 7B2 precursor [Ancylostoma duodenale]|uniref:Neuroendocrine protein 7B2 n=1 Tax=Ancylostoma duodenale TaxID=51022 RepID=A0A0C2GMX2_9BILA|nr:neuroendocrine protein 7B2 precursor [Ancylostoma duodenale]
MATKERRSFLLGGSYRSSSPSSVSELALLAMLALLPLLAAHVLAFDLESDFIIDDLGGAGEGEQKLREEENFQQRQEVKSDNVLPAYCEPPNPCPVGYTAADGCIEEFENRIFFSVLNSPGTIRLNNTASVTKSTCSIRKYSSCAEKEASDLGASLQELLDEHSLHRNMIAKKFHEKRSSDEVCRLDRLAFLNAILATVNNVCISQQLPPRRKRSIRHPPPHQKTNPYLQGEILKTVAKKNGRNVW